MKFDVVLIGGGLGSLSAAAFLAKSGKSTLVLERTNTLGGRCRGVELMGHSFDIGADYFGRKTLKTLGKLGKASQVKPVPFKTLAYSDGGSMTIPPGLHSIGDLSRLGLSTSQMAGFGLRMGRQLLFNGYKKISNNHDMVEKIAENARLRDILGIGAFFSGNAPDNMPGYWFNLIFGNTYGYNRPFYPRGGSGAIPALLADVVRENGGGIVYGAEPTAIIIEGGRAKGVVLGGREISADAVVSGIGIKYTVDSLVGKEHFPSGYIDTLSYYREGFTMASVFVVFRRIPAIKKGVHIYANFSGNMVRMFRELAEKRFPEKSMSVLSCPDAILGGTSDEIAGTVKFLIPKGGAEKAAIEVEAEKVLMDMDQLVPGFHGSIIDRKVFTPKDYMDHFGFVSSLSPVAESVHYEKMPGETPVPGLFCAGSTVLPVGGCTASSVESGRLCADGILKKKS